MGSRILFHTTHIGEEVIIIAVRERSPKKFIRGKPQSENLSWNLLLELSNSTYILE
jgi:hypothetical protein